MMSCICVSTGILYFIIIMWVSENDIFSNPFESSVKDFADFPSQALT